MSEHAEYLSSAETLEYLPSAETLKMNAMLQQKKSALRRALAAKGPLKRKGLNEFDHYRYFSEAQYKELFTELLPANKLELSFTELNYSEFPGTDKLPFGRRTRIAFTLTDVETGFSESSVISGEGLDKGDKAGYKAYTGATKYYLASTFLVSTGDDVEGDNSRASAPAQTRRKVTPAQAAVIKNHYQGDALTALLALYNVGKIEDLPMSAAGDIFRELNRRG